MDKIRIVIRLLAVTSLIAFFAFMFANSKSSHGMSNTPAKLIEIKDETVVFQISFSDREIVLDDLNGMELVVGEWYELSFKETKWGYDPLSFVVESTYSLKDLWERG